MKSNFSSILPVIVVLTVAPVLAQRVVHNPDFLTARKINLHKVYEFVTRVHMNTRRLKAEIAEKLDHARVFLWHRK